MRSLPQARTPDPRSAPPQRWGVLGTGWIAARFVAALHASTDQRVVAVGSRGAGRASEFAARLGIPHAHEEYAGLLGRADVDVVYVATEHTAHLDCARQALEAGKPVLVEKPLAVNATQAAEIAALARTRGVFCMEAFWTFCLPKYDVLRQVLADGLLGDVQSVLADVGEDLTGHRRAMRADLAGGPMLDLGTYAFGLARWVLGDQRLVGADGRQHAAGVNGQLSALLSDADGRSSLLHASAVAETPTAAVVTGSEATLVIDGPFYQPGGFRLRRRDGEVLAYDEPASGHADLFWQAAEAARCLAEGRQESPLRPLDESVATLSTMDEVRAALGIVFPGERPTT